MLRIDLDQENLSQEQLEQLDALRRQCSADIVTMTSVAGCGHPGGSMSTLPALLLLYATCNVAPEKVNDPDRDRIFVSHGHISPGTYSVLSAFGFCDRHEMLVTFRHPASEFGGHVEIGIPGVEWNTGNLGQGLSAGAGAALGARLRDAVPGTRLQDQDHGARYRVVVLQGDGEQQKGQIAEARRLAAKYKLQLLTIVDVNKLQITGSTDDVMPQDLAAGYRSDGWDVIESDGHDWQELYSAIRAGLTSGRPTAILARTVMGKGVSFMEDLAKFHGSALPRKEAAVSLGAALDELGATDRSAELLAERAELPLPGPYLPQALGTMPPPAYPAAPVPALEVRAGRVYTADAAGDFTRPSHAPRNAYGAVMKELAEDNNTDRIRVVGFDCDLEGSVKLNGFHKAAPAGFIEAGIQEHNTAVAAGRLSKDGFNVFFSTFGMFAVSEVYNQLRLNDYNGASLKVVATHCGLDVGEDGPTHQCVDYLGLLGSTFNWEMFTPADANQCDRMVRNIAGRPGCQFIGMSRSALPLIRKEDGTPYFDADYVFTPGKADVVREGDGTSGSVLVMGAVAGHAQEAVDRIARATGRRVRLVVVGSIRPFDVEAVRAAAGTGFILTAEDHHRDTGLGARVAQVIAEEGLACRLTRVGAHRFCMSGPARALYRWMGLDADALEQRLLALLG